MGITGVFSAGSHHPAQEHAPTQANFQQWQQAQMAAPSLLPISTVATEQIVEFSTFPLN